MVATPPSSSTSTNHGTLGLTTAAYGDCVRVIRADRDFNRFVIQQLEQDGWDDVQIFHDGRDVDAATRADDCARNLASGLARFSMERVEELRAALDGPEVRAATKALGLAFEKAAGEVRTVARWDV